MFSLKSQDQGTIVLSQEDYIPLIVESFLVDRKAQSVSPGTLSFYQKKLKYLSVSRFAVIVRARAGDVGRKETG